MRKARSKILSPAQLSRKLARDSKLRKSIVFTNGCFDLLHAGHASYLERARGLGKALVVALNSDATVKKIKGRDRPLNKLADRMAVLASLECVDYVTWFGELTPLKIIQKIKPGILVKGGDWPVSKMVGAKEVLGWGGRVKSLPYLKGRSTTRLIRKARSGE